MFMTPLLIGTTSKHAVLQQNTNDSITKIICRSVFYKYHVSSLIDSINKVVTEEHDGLTKHIHDIY